MDVKNHEKSSIKKSDENIACGYLMSTIWALWMIQITSVMYTELKIVSKTFANP